MTTENQGKGMWVHFWVPLPDATSTTTITTTEHPPSSNMIFDVPPTNSFLPTGNASPSFIPDLSNSPESFIPSPYESSPQAALDLSLTMDDLTNDPLLFPPSLDMPLGGELDISPDLDFDIGPVLGGDMVGLPVAATTTNPFSESDVFSQFVDWNLGLDAASVSPSTAALDSFSQYTSSSSHTPAIPPLPTPPYLGSNSHNNTLPPLLPLQPASPPASRPVAPTPYRCSTCSKAYSKRCDLTKHERKHIKPHRCQLCEFGSAELRGLQRHMWASHRDVAEQKGVPKQIARCDHPGCAYEGRLDNLIRHMKRHEKAKAKRAARR